MKSHQNTIGKNDEWLTPPEILDKLGPFDLDPCDAVGNPFKTANTSYTANGLEREWFGRVWLNPPFNRKIRPEWMEKMAKHGNGIMLVPAAGETEAFYKTVWGTASGILFLKGRPHFHYITGKRARANSGCTICLVAYGEENLNALYRSGLGFCVRIQSL